MAAQPTGATLNPESPAVAVTPVQLSEALSQLRQIWLDPSSTGLATYLATMATYTANARRVAGIFPRRSVRNTALLELQRLRLGEAHMGLYAGVRQWATMGRSVSEAAVAKTIWAFGSGIKRTLDDDGNDADPQASAAAQRTGMKFVRVGVYDYSDTLADDPDFVEPAWHTPLASGQGSAIVDRLVDSSPVPVRFDSLSSSAHTWARTRSGITLDAGLDSANAVLALASALTAHHRGHGYTGREKDEDAAASAKAEAALGGWLCVHMLGVADTAQLAPSVVAYLRSGVDEATGKVLEGHKGRFKLLTARADVAFGAAEHIVDDYLATPAVVR